MAEPTHARFILTVQVPIDGSDAVERVLKDVARHLHGRLTRSERVEHETYAVQTKQGKRIV